MIEKINTMHFDLSNKDFIEKLFKKSIKSFEIGEGCKEGDNVAGSLKSIVATTSTEETIAAVYKFFPPKDSQIYVRIKERKVFRTECDAYTVLAKELEEFVESRSDPSTKTGKKLYSIPMPKLYTHFNDDENDYICLEDVRPQGFVMPIIFKGLSYLETSLVLQELARFHAYTYALIRHHGEKLFEPTTGKFARFDFTKWRSGDCLTQWHGFMSGAVQNATDILHEVNPPLSKIMQEKIPAVKAGSFIDAFRTITDVEIFPCIVHGDIWSNNLLLKYGDEENSEGERKPVAVKFVDFQFTRRGNIFEDLIYFIFTSTNTEFRKKHLHRVLREYYNSFKNALQIIHFPMPINFSLRFLIDNFSRFTKSGLVYMCFAIPLQMGKPNQVTGQSEPKPNKRKKTAEAVDDVSKTPENGLNENGTDSSTIIQPDFLHSLRCMIENSPPALKRLHEIAEEVLVSDA